MPDLQAYSPYLLIAAIGLVAGWLSGLLLGGGGLIRNLFVGVIGAFVGGFLLRNGLLPIPDSVAAWAGLVPYGLEILVATFGAILVVVLARILGR